MWTFKSLESHGLVNYSAASLLGTAVTTTSDVFVTLFLFYHFLKPNLKKETRNKIKKKENQSGIIGFRLSREIAVNCRCLHADLILELVQGIS